MNDRTKTLDKFRGCLIGGAAGDALGYEVEFMLEEDIIRRFGKSGITEYVCRNGKAVVSDDTQMTLFTANGLLYSKACGNLHPSDQDYIDCIFEAYRQWYETQYHRQHIHKDFHSCWLMHVPELYACRAPGNTCLSAIGGGRGGTMSEPVNQSKGCGGVMRVAPIGLFFDPNRMPILDIDLLGAAAAALTHGHEMGYIPAAMLVHIIALLSHSECISVEEAVLDSIDAMQTLYGEKQELPAFLKRIRTAVDLGTAQADDLEAIHTMGAGWIGDEALAIAVFCSVKYADDFDRAMVAAVNHSGDSDSTGAIAGNILGARLGISGIPEKYLKQLEMLDVLYEIADDLCCNDPQDENWRRKYVTVTYMEKEKQL